MSRFYGYFRLIYNALPDFMKKAIKYILASLQKNSNPNLSTRDNFFAVERKAVMLSHISPLTQEGLEIGPLCWPVVTKEESNGQIYYVDFSTAEKSREKYKNDPNVNIDAIVETDYLWGKQTLPELVERKLFDYVVASHVIEHVPNMLGWLREIATVLKDQGILSLAIPDKRFTFDYKRDLTSLGDLIESYLLDKRRPSIRDIFDQVSLATKVNVVEAWSGKLIAENLKHHGTLQEAFAQATEYLHSDEYNDVHVNIMTPASFIDILEKASQLELFDFTIAEFHTTAYNSHEFLVSLQRIDRKGNKEDTLKLQLDNIKQIRQKI